MSGENRSRVPGYTFPDTLAEQWEALRSNPLLNRMKKARALHSDLHRPRYHYVNPEGSLNDPNGLCFWHGNKHILLFFSHTGGGQYLLGDYDQEEQKFHITSGEKFNFGPAGPGGVHAPSATPLDDGSIIAIFNMNPAMPTQGWNQIMTLPRRLTLNENGNDVDVSVGGAVDSLRNGGTELLNLTIPVNEDFVLDSMQGNCYELAIEMEPQEHSAFVCDVLRSPDMQEYTRITCYRDRGYADRANYARDRTSLVTLDNTHCSIAPEFRARAPEILNVPIPRNEPLKLRIFVDRSVVEVFVNDRKCMAPHV